jgi:tetratricopeptide (TPR) repeat protein
MSPAQTPTLEREAGAAHPGLPSAGDPPARAPSDRLLVLGACAAVIALALGAYWGSLGSGFVYDDVPQVLENLWIRSPRNLLSAFTSSAWGFTGMVSNYYRPMMHVVYTVAHALSGLDPTAFHAANLLLHAAASVLVLAIAFLLLRTDTERRPALALATGAAVLFALHPIHTEAVCWVGGVPDLAATVFGLASVYLYATAPPGTSPSLSVRYVLSVAAFLAAALSKEIALVLPALLVVHDLALRRDGRSLLRRSAAWVPFGMVALAYLALRWNALGAFAPVRRHAQLGAPGLALNAAALFAGYLEKLVVPARLTVFHEFHPVVSAAEPRALAGVAAVVLFGAAGAWLWKASRRGFVAWALVLLPLLPALYIPGVGENPFAERYLYLPSVGFVWLLALGARAGWAARPRLWPGLAAAAAALAATYAAATVARLPVWRDDVSLWTDAARRSPGAPIPHYNLAIALHQRGRTVDAIPEYEAALRIEESANAWSSLGAAYRDVGDAGRAIAALGRAIELNPGLAAPYGNLGAVLLDAGRDAEAVELLRSAVALDPAFSGALHNLGVAYERLGRRNEAIASFAAALRADPSNSSAAAHLQRLGVSGASSR